MKRIVSTRPDGGVSVTVPTPEFMAFFTCGGAPAGYWGAPLDRCVQIERMVKRGVRERVALRYVNALLCGGCTDAEAYEIIRDRDTPADWSGKELWTLEELPDRWFRDAWRRSHNGGPIRIDIETARAIQFRRIADGIDCENRRRRGNLWLRDRLIEVDMIALRDRVLRSDEPDELYRIWPGQLPRAHNRSA